MRKRALHKILTFMEQQIVGGNSRQSSATLRPKIESLDLLWVDAILLPLLPLQSGYKPALQETVTFMEKQV